MTSTADGAAEALTMTTATTAHANSSASPKPAAVSPLLQGAILPTLLRLAVPNVLALVMSVLVGIAETYYVEQLGWSAGGDGHRVSVCHAHADDEQRCHGRRRVVRHQPGSGRG